jgi:hypothetical protein
MYTDKKDFEEKKKQNPEFRPEDLKEGEVIPDERFGKLIMISPHHFITPDGTHLTEI